MSWMSEKYILIWRKRIPFFILDPKLVYARTEKAYSKKKKTICINIKLIGQCDLQTLYYIQSSIVSEAKL